MGPVEPPGGHRACGFSLLCVMLQSLIFGIMNILGQPAAQCQQAVLV
jgi:hypothetical protein